MAKKPAHSPDTARKIWLAGIGAYGRAFSEAQEQVAKLGGSSARVFDELVAKGEAIEKTVEARGRKVAAKLAPGAHSFDERIKKMRERIMHGEDDASLADEVGELRARVASLEAKVKTLSGARAAPKRKAVRKKKA
ncbi:MAG: phasin family protein [Pseudomonadota bacterium]